MDFLPVTLLKVETVADRTKAFSFSKPEGFAFLAGQYAMLRIPADRLVESDVRSGMRPLSIASAPSEAELVFVMREGVTGFKKTMWDLKVGESILLGGPLGHATVPVGDSRPVAILSGGVGVAPARSMLRDAVATGDTRKYVFFYSNRYPIDAPFHKEFMNLTLPDFHYIYTYSAEETTPTLLGEERGRISADMIRKHLPEWQESLYYVIGAPAFADAMRAMLAEMGIPDNAVHIDPFSGLTGAAQAAK
ncbi:MAG TPA: FAD-dependent oxidoreductase [Candidatus Fimivivens sp.]|nr:FAD-dependent oxidoreductase [Candidatus Fimivivens sp.]